MAPTDALTGLPDGHAFGEVLERELGRAGRYREPLWLAMIELDPRGAPLGARAGDPLVRQTAEQWKPLLGDGDVLARCGKERFALVLSAVSLELAVATVNRISWATPRRRTCSTGLVSHHSGESAAQLVDRAERALEEAQSRGGDETVLAP